MVTYSHSDLNVRNPPDEVSNSFINDECTEPSTSGTSPDDQMDTQLLRNCRGASLGAVGSLRYVDDYEILETLGKGFFGVVYKVRDKRCNDYKSRTQPNIMVMKEPVVSNTHSPLCAKKIVCREYYMLRLLKHPNILKTRGVCIKQNRCEWHLRLLVDYCEGGSLQEVTLSLHKSFPWLDRLHIVLDICKGMQFVHRNGFMHRDLTATNVLLQKTTSPPWRRMKAVVADFGLSCRIPKLPEVKQQVGTSNYMAPELLKELFYDEKADVFSAGIIMCQMIARIDSDHDTGIYRTSKFGLDYVRFAAHCPSDTPLNWLKTAFTCCLLAPTSRPSFESLVEQIQQIINEDFPKGSDSFDDSRLGRSHSDATIRGAKTPSITTLNGRRSFRPDQLSIPEGVPLDENNFATTPSENNELDERIKQLAETVAECDPDYKESTMNPFACHPRYRSIRKIKPGDRYFVRPEHSKEEPEISIKDTNVLVKKQRNHRRSVSMPSIFLDFERPKISRNPLTKFSKRSFTLGLGEQRDLQGRIVATFREYDQKFNNISRSGILLSSNDLSRLSNESLDKSILPSDDNEDVSDGDEIFANSSRESLSPKNLIQSSFPISEYVSSSSCSTTTRDQINGNGLSKEKEESLFDKNNSKVNDKRNFFRKKPIGSEDCRIL